MLFFDSTEMNLTEKQFRKLSELVYHECGINLHEGKRQLLQARLSKRLRKTGIKTVKEYLKVLETDQKELIHFLDAVSTNHTFFFRESQHFEILEPSHLNIWCAACSSGEEPYSVAIYCLEKGFRPSILATDISTNVLGIAKRAVYPMERARMVPQHVLRKYFQKGQGKWEDYIRVKEEVRRMVTFGRFNLVLDPLPAREFDVIFCRNVLIYFDNLVKEKVINRLYRLLKWNGYFIIGGAESLNSIRHMYKYVKPSIYRKVGGVKAK
ncbi:MAG: protein-glutamate O-methyltransferase CheR [Deltaproteobacteria bacterium]|nr:protein-glutamate O-methyltransferase CheR [Deltaproteobacteria bacterium]MBW2017565.1 protein-glutamate O-methyltransferase CheR [Deltaproteobacteria bacterium]MBW2130255.1 protein-glutamate O-methyltransferase CheR [Deltaproteobacteria bacterium]MBW2302539.1 protein-glutamate O-methyltransferase CheR [Deltaproteobacteria bacterium]